MRRDERGVVADMLALALLPPQILDIAYAAKTNLLERYGFTNDSR